MKKIRFFALLCSMIMIFSTVANAATFSDMPTDPAAKQVIENAVKNGILAGSDGMVRPDAFITRAEMASIITRACGAEKEGNISKFNDVKRDKWYYSAVAKAYEMGALSGSGNKMNPENYISFQECFTVLSNVFDLVPTYTINNDDQTTLPANSAIATVNGNTRVYDISLLSQFSDANEIADWAKIYVAGVVYHGGWNGINGKITPTQNITRLQFATVMDNLFKNYINEPGTYTSLPEGNTLVRCNGAVLKNITTSDDIYIADGVSANGVTIENVTSTGRVVVRGCSTPVVDENEGISWGDVGIKISGKYESVRIIRPYINIDLTNASFNSLYTVKKTHFTSFAQ